MTSAEAPGHELPDPDEVLPRRIVPIMFARSGV